MSTTNGSSCALRGLALLATALAVGACGGSGSSGTAGIDAGGAPQPIAAAGPITGFGSVIVGGRRFDSSMAGIVVDGQPGAESALGVGQIVAVVGSVDTAGATATRLELDLDVRGPIAAVDESTRRIDVLGQTVQVDADTSFDRALSPATVEALGVGQMVAVSGWRDAAGVLYASRIDPAAAGELQVKGRVEAADAVARRFRIGGQSVDYGAARLDGFAVGGVPVDGDIVRVLGGALGAGGVLPATAVERKNAARFATTGMAAPSSAEVEGFVTRFVSAADFTVEGLAVRATAQTVFLNGSGGELGLNSRLRVEADIDGTGLLIAQRITFRRAGVLRIEATVDAIDSANGTVTLLGMAIRVGPRTRLEDKSATGQQAFGLAQLRVGDPLELRGYEDPPGSGAVTATKIEREDDDGDDVEIDGVVRAVQEPEFFILGVRVLTDASTEFDDMTRNEFFTQGVGRRVEVEGRYVSGVLIAEEIEWSDDDGDSDDD